MFKGNCRPAFQFKLFVIQWTFLLVLTILSYLYVGDLIQGLINSQLVVSPDSDIYSLWKQPPVNPVMKIYLFNLTNVQAWLNGSQPKLRLEQIGPFVYRETWIKKNITFHSENSSVSYYQIKRFEFLPELSLSEDLMIALPNIPLFSAAASMKNANAWSLMGLNAALNMIDPESKQFFIRRTAREVIWGYDDTLSAFASFVLPPEEVGAPGKFGLFAGKNSTLGGMYTVDTGAKNLKHLSQTIEYRGKKSFTAWRTRACNKVRGADGSFFPPWISSSDTLEVFVPDLCGTIPLTSKGEEVTYEPGRVNTLRFRPHPHTFRYDVPENRCFCSAEGTQVEEEQDESEEEAETEDWLLWSNTDRRRKRAEPKMTCPDLGVFDLSSCKFGAPLFLSWPHFYNADKKFSDSLEGLHLPNESAHGLRMDIQPTMGLGLSANIRLQMNLKVEKSALINKLGDLPIESGQTLLIPIMWFDNEIDRPPTNLLILLGDALSTGDKISRGVLIFSTIFLSVQICLFASYMVWKRSSSMVENFDEIDKELEVLKVENN